MAKSKEIVKVNIRPLMGYVLLKMEEPVNTTASGIILPDSAKEKPSFATVAAVGDPIQFDNGRSYPSPVGVGQRVLYKGGWGDQEIKGADGQSYKVVKFEELIAVWED